MTKSFKIPAYFTVINWVLAVIIGSFMIPITFSMTKESYADFRHIELEGVLMFMAISAICSVPAMVILLISNLILNKRSLSRVQFVIIQSLIHLIVSILTFVVLNEIEGMGFDFFFTVGCTYFGTGAIIWLIVMLLHKEKTTEEVKLNDELIDSI